MLPSSWWVFGFPNSVSLCVLGRSLRSTQCPVPASLLSSSLDVRLPLLITQPAGAEGAWGAWAGFLMILTGVLTFQHCPPWRYTQGVEVVSISFPLCVCVILMWLRYWKTHVSGNCHFSSYSYFLYKIKVIRIFVSRIWFMMKILQF